MRVGLKTNDGDYVDEVDSGYYEYPILLVVVAGIMAFIALRMKVQSEQDLGSDWRSR